MIGFLVVIGIVALLIIWAISLYNTLVALKNRFKNAFSQIDVQLQRRHDLIPNLVETAKAYMTHEKEALTAVIAARNEATASAKLAAANPDNAQAIQKAAANESILNSSVTRFLALAEQYPDLKANQTMGQLMEELSSTENKVAFARQAFNDAVMEYNTAREQFPNSLIAGFGSFPPAQLFEVDSAEIKSVPKVSF